MATLVNFGSKIEHFNMDAEKSSLVARQLKWKSSTSQMIKVKGITDPQQKEDGRKLQKVYETLPELPENQLPVDPTVYDIATSQET